MATSHNFFLALLFWFLFQNTRTHVSFWELSAPILVFVTPNGHGNQLRILIKFRFWFSPSGVGPEVLHFPQAPRGCRYRWFWTHAWSSRVPPAISLRPHWLTRWYLCSLSCSPVWQRWDNLMPGCSLLFIWTPRVYVSCTHAEIQPSALQLPESPSIRPGLLVMQPVAFKMNCILSRQGDFKKYSHALKKFFLWASLITLITGIRRKSLTRLRKFCK